MTVSCADLWNVHTRETMPMHDWQMEKLAPGYGGAEWSTAATCSIEDYEVDAVPVDEEDRPRSASTARVVEADPSKGLELSNREAI